MSQTNAVEILLVEDTPQDLELALRALKKANLSNRIQVAPGRNPAMTEQKSTPMGAVNHTHFTLKGRCRSGRV